ncbi:hypothetical protein BV25DRAFT_1918773 [Artomyces pyxidatus]|uniref:Uncharacterized protein n=1 Tax=Artomyces pyxidatus TaxID=48021 RepID=A0ACB8SRD3_9AGAM|nr:hypothetical protein BV25DRAFT_1918773 [Artomyces pyxidatus]
MSPLPDAAGTTDGSSQRDRPECHTTLWYDDGNAIILAGSVLFKVHQHILSKSSPIWKACCVMNSQRTSDGFPVLRLDEDPLDVEHVLNGLYDTKNTIEARAVPLESVSAWLRLGTKYKISSLREDAIERLKSWSPNSCQLYEQIIVAHLPEATTKTISRLPDDCVASYIVANLALTHNLPQLLPYALYDCCRDIDRLMESVDKTVASYGRGIDCASPEIWRKLLVGRSKLVTLRAKTAFSFLTRSHAPKCLNVEQCTSTAQDMWDIAHAGRWTLDNADALQDLADHFIDKFAKNACTNCTLSWKEKFYISQQKIWDNLPDCFGIELSNEQWIRTVIA